MVDSLTLSPQCRYTQHRPHQNGVRLAHHPHKEVAPAKKNHVNVLTRKSSVFPPVYFSEKADQVRRKDKGFHSPPPNIAHKQKVCDENTADQKRRGWREHGGGGGAMRGCRECMSSQLCSMATPSGCSLRRGTLDLVCVSAPTERVCRCDAAKGMNAISRKNTTHSHRHSNEQSEAGWRWGLGKSWPSTPTQRYSAHNTLGTRTQGAG